MELVDELNVLVIGSAAKEQGNEQMTQFTRIALALVSVSNDPQTAAWIMRRTKISRNSLSQILHRTHKDSFVSFDIPGYSRKKLWALTDEAAERARRLLDKKEKKEGQGNLFENVVSEFEGIKATDCCEKILAERNNEPTSALTLARESLARGYKGEPHGTEDEKLLRTAKSFWAALGRDERFAEVRPLVFALKPSVWNRISH